MSTERKKTRKHFVTHDGLGSGKGGDPAVLIGETSEKAPVVIDPQVAGQFDPLNVSVAGIEFRDFIESVDDPACRGPENQIIHPGVEVRKGRRCTPGLNLDSDLRRQELLGVEIGGGRFDLVAAIGIEAGKVGKIRSTKGLRQSREESDLIAFIQLL